MNTPRLRYWTTKWFDSPINRVLQFWQDQTNHVTTTMSFSKILNGHYNFVNYLILVILNSHDTMFQRLICIGLRDVRIIQRIRYLIIIALLETFMVFVTIILFNTVFGNIILKTVRFAIEVLKNLTKIISFSNYFPLTHKYENIY